MASDPGARKTLSGVATGVSGARRAKNGPHSDSYTAQSIPRRGVALHEFSGTVVAQIAEITVSGTNIAVDRVVCAVDCGIAVTPDVVEAQMQGGIGYGLSAALWGEITLTGGRVDQSNFNSYRVLRINEMPKVVEVHILPSMSEPTGVGEAGTPPIAPAVANAVRAATGIRLRRMPFDLAAARRVNA